MGGTPRSCQPRTSKRGRRADGRRWRRPVGRAGFLVPAPLRDTADLVEYLWVGGVRAEADGLVRPVEVARTGDEQAEPVGERPYLAPLLRRVILVLRLEPVQPGRGHLLDQLVRNDPTALGGSGVGEDRHPTGPADQAQGEEDIGVLFGHSPALAEHGRRKRL